MLSRRSATALLLLGASATAFSEEPAYDLGTIVVTATRIPSPDVAAPYASEVHTRQMIEASGATSLYDYLAQQTSINILPGYGNRFTPLIDMRGYGTASGYENVVVTVDGRRLNNIDLSSPLLGAIPLTDVDRIEITKGSGSVLFGDGATAGTIQIYTRPHTGASVAASLGNYGARDITGTAGLNKEKVSLTVTGNYSGVDGYSDPDPTGHRDESSNRTWRGGIEVRPTDRLKLSLDGASTHIDARYPSPLTLAQFNADPAQVGNNPWASPTNAYNHQVLDSDLWGVGLAADLGQGIKLTAKHDNEDKRSAYPSWVANYDYASDDLGLLYDRGALSLAAGIQRFDGVRAAGGNDTRKRNLGYYLQGQYHLDRTTLSLGARQEKVSYTYTPATGAALDSDHDLFAWDIGVNRELDPDLTLFANYNRAYQAPDIDRFFNYGGTFNGFIVPAVSRTFNLGLNHVKASNRLKLTLFHANLAHEIYYDPLSYTNTNLDKTHKYGLELQDSWRATDRLTARVNYTYTRAIIDNTSQANGAYDGKDLPGVPRHGVVLGLDWQASQAMSMNLTQVWRAKAYAVNDFANDFAQRQAAYMSTNLALRYRLKKLEYFASVDNLFAHKNGEWIRDDDIYPVDFTRNWRVGVKASF
jgi:iron complex outermembrane receptor protein